MGLSSSEDDRKPTFSNSVLCLQIYGPNEEHLSVIEVPGIFKNTTSGCTTKNIGEVVSTIGYLSLDSPDGFLRSYGFELMILLLRRWAYSIFQSRI
jgi:hypothetical protein